MQKRFMQQVQMQRIQTQLWLTVAQPIGLWGTGLMLTGATIAFPAAIAQAASLQWQYDPESAALSVNLPPGTTPRYFLAAQPARIVVDLPNTDVGAVQTEKQFPGAIQHIRIAQFQPGITRIVMQLAPGTVLAPQQVDLQQNGDRWVLRPLLADANTAANQPIAAVNPAATPAPLSEETNPAPTAANPAPADQPSANLPPLEPDATEIPVELPPAESAIAAPATVSVPSLSAVAANPTPAASTQTSSPQSSTQSSSPSETVAVESPEAEIVEPSASPENAPRTPQAPESQAVETTTETTTGTMTGTTAETNVNPAEATTAALPAELPPAEPNFLPAELPPAEPDSLPTELPSAEPNSLPADLPPAIATPTSESTVNVPALNSPHPAPARTREVAAIEFGQPLPGGQPARAQARETSHETSRDASPDAVAVNSAPGVLLPSGTVLSLRYQGQETLKLSGDYPLQEVLVVDRDVRDQAGQIIVPAGSQVIGRFETGSAGSEFIAQAISIDGQNFLLNGKSDKLSGDRQVPGNRMLQNSAIGAVAGTLLGAVTGVGLILGIAAGAASSAATTYFTAPQPAVIEPDRVVEVRLLEDLRQPGFGIGG